MDHAQTWRTRFLHRFHARRAARRDVTTRFVTPPEPRTVGRFARGRQLVNGTFLLGGTFVQMPNSTIWEVHADSPLVLAEAHRCEWLDDLAALGDSRARGCATDWVLDWITRFGDGSGPGWHPALTGRRLICWINHGAFLLRGQPPETSDKLFRSLGQQTLFLSKTWATSPPGLARFEAICGTIIAGLALEGLGDVVMPAVTMLAADCARDIDQGGGVPTRNPEHLLEIFSLLTWAFDALSDAGQVPPPALHLALNRMAPTLRALRHADGGLARFHGGGRGVEGRLDHALAASKVRVSPSQHDELHMGYARLMVGRSTVIVDAAPPPAKQAGADAHASTLAFELTSGRRPMIVNCGSGRSFGDAWRKAGRATPSHTTLSLNGVSSSQFGTAKQNQGQSATLVTRPQVVHCDASVLEDGRRLELSHDGYRQRFGLTHARIIDIASDGCSLVGEDFVAAVNDADKRIFDHASKSRQKPFGYTIRFHLHPDVDAKVDLAGGAVSLVLKSGEVWVFRHDGAAELALEPSVYLEMGRLKPRAAQQVVLSGTALDYASRVRWSLAKAQDTPDAVRDLTPRRAGADDNATQ